MLTAGTRRRAPETLLAAGLGGALALSTAVPYSTLLRGPVVCPFLAVTGIPCPTCGMTRSWNLTAHGDITAALALHPMGPLTFAAATVVLVVLVVRLMSRRWLVPVPAMTTGVVLLGVTTGLFGMARWAGMWGTPYA